MRRFWIVYRSFRKLGFTRREALGAGLGNAWGAARK